MKFWTGKEKNTEKLKLHLNDHTKKCIYYSHIYSHISIWSNSVTCKQEKIINTIQKYCIKAILNTPKNTPSDPLFKSLKIMKFNEIKRFELCKLAHNLKEKELPMPLMELFNDNSKKKHIDIPQNSNNFRI